MPDKKPGFEIGRVNSSLEFQVYDFAWSEQAAMKAYRERIKKVESPEEIRIFDEGGAIPRKDLEDQAVKTT